jgi:hypothetical protein
MAATEREITTKNKQTGRMEIIKQRGLEMVDWGFHFFVDGELEAYKAAYHYKDAPHGVKVEFAGGAKQWMVTVFNEHAANMGLDGARKAA